MLGPRHHSLGPALRSMLETQTKKPLRTASLGLEVVTCLHDLRNRLNSVFPAESEEIYLMAPSHSGPF